MLLTHYDFLKFIPTHRLILALMIKNVKLGSTAIVPIKLHLPAWFVEERRNVATEMACAVLETAVTMVFA